MRHAGALGAVASIGGAIAVTLASTGIRATSEANAPLNDDHQQRVEPGAVDLNVAFGLRRSTVVTLDIGETPNVPILVEVPIGGEVFTLDLQPHSLRAETYQVLVQVEDGSLVEVEPEPIRTLRGVVAEDPASIVSGSLLQDGLHAAIRFTNGDLYWLEPIGSRIPGAAANDYVVYHNDDVLETGGVCGIDALQRFPNIVGADGGGGVAGGPCGNVLYIAELGCDADFEYFSDYGSVAAVQNRINLIINTVNVQYEIQVQITHEITAIIVRTVSGPPYTSTSAGTLLDQFHDEWLTNQVGIRRDLAHLFTGKNLNGDTIGIAWNIGVVCVFQQHYSLVQSDYNGNFSCATDLTTHELGHIWGADHCGSGCFPPTDCTCFTHTMRCAITCANNFSAPCTRPEIIAHRNTVPCLDCDVDPDPIGACCFGNGTCSEETQADCISFGGTYQGDGASCSPNPCPQPPIGACCLVGNFCAVVSSFTCTDSGGTYQGDGTNCSPDPCIPPTGACCASDGTCGEVTLELCDLVGGIYQGDGISCSPNPCPQPTGACCFTDGSCLVQTLGDCNTAGGIYQGDGSDCATTFCRECQFNGDCNDFNACTVDTCDPIGVCINTPIDPAVFCDDADACTVDTCDPVLGCINTPIDPTLVCDDGNACTVDTCDPLLGCINTPINPCCGNGVPEAGEDCSNCPGDVQCPPGTECIVGVCEPLPSVADIAGPLGPGFPDGCVDAFDLAAMLGAWCSGVNDPNPPSPPCENCTPANLAIADISGSANVPDGCIDAFDLAKLLAEWCSVAGGNPCGTCFAPP
ncbi:MAG: hypothetical protein IH983_14885 [Planctomycetes bacterium]|nr:hypothetical protein [Planctomycetota bacterium]